MPPTAFVFNMVKNPPSIRALTTGLVSSRFSSCSGEAAAIAGMRSRAFWTCGWMAGIAFLRLRGDAVPMDNSFAPRPGQESHTSGTACRLCWVRIPPHRPPYRAQGREYRLALDDRSMRKIKAAEAETTAPGADMAETDATAEDNTTRGGNRGRHRPAPARSRGSTGPPNSRRFIR